MSKYKPTHELDEVTVEAHPFGNDDTPNEKFVTVEVGEVVLNLSPGEAEHFGRDLSAKAREASAR